jgi:hypothetical protein
MITGTRSVAGVPAAQKQPRDRQQRRRQRRKRKSSDGDDSHREVDSLGRQEDAMVIDSKVRGKHSAKTPSGIPAKERQASQHPGRKPRHVDIRV